jgi:hypothetical protein
MRDRILVSLAVLELPRREQARLEPSAMALQVLLNPLHTHDVDPDSSDGHRTSSLKLDRSVTRSGSVVTMAEASPDCRNRRFGGSSAVRAGMPRR